jgi:hypothetical protein
MRLVTTTCKRDISEFPLHFIVSVTRRVPIRFKFTFGCVFPHETVPGTRPRCLNPCHIDGVLDEVRESFSTTSPYEAIRWDASTGKRIRILPSLKIYYYDEHLVYFLNHKHY